MGQKRKVSEADRAVRRKHLLEGHASPAWIAGIRGSECHKAASRLNAQKATSTRTARAILKALPPGAASGTTFTACQTRRITVIDPAPRKDGNRWIQSFHQSQTVTAAGARFTRSGIIRIVWTEEPTLDKILSSWRKYFIICRSVAKFVESVCPSRHIQSVRAVGSGRLLIICRL